MKKFLLLFTTILSSLYLVAQDSISVGFYVGTSAVAFKETPAYMPRIGSVSVFVANNFMRFRFDTGLRLTEDYYTLDKKESTGENYKAKCLYFPNRFITAYASVRPSSPALLRSARASLVSPMKMSVRARL